MAELPPTPDNAARIWVPSQISPNKVETEDRPDQFSGTDKLSQSQIASLNVSRAPPILPPNPEVPIPAAGYGGKNPPPATTPSVTGSMSGGAYSGYGPYGAGACFIGVGVGPYGYGYQYLRPAQPQVNVNVNGFLRSGAGVGQRQQNHPLPYQPSVFGVARRGTGVFHPSRPRVTNNSRPGNNRGQGMRNKQGADSAEVNPQARRSRNSSKGDRGLVKLKQEECHQHQPCPEMGLPTEWTY